MAGAVTESHRLGCNPGGEVEGVGPAQTTVADGWANRLLNREECEQFEREHAHASKTVP